MGSSLSLSISADKIHFTLKSENVQLLAITIIIIISHEATMVCI